MAKRKRYDTSKIEPELGMSLDELNKILNDPDKWITEDEMIRRLKKLINESEEATIAKSKEVRKK